MKPFYQDAQVTLYHGDFREHLDEAYGVDLIVTDPPWGSTDLKWDQWIPHFPDYLNGLVQHERYVGSFWCIGPFRLFWEHADEFPLWKLAQDVVWEKHNGANVLADRFRPVHVLAVQFYQGAWKEVYKNPVYVADATRRRVRHSHSPAHLHGYYGQHTYSTEEGGKRLMRSVIYAPSMHGQSINPTQKPFELLAPLIEYSCPPGGLVFDPCAGSGSTLMAAKLLGRRGIGFEIREEQCKTSAQWLSQQVGITP